MAWKTDETKRKLREAAIVEFAEHGPMGTTIEQIARRAGVNKERLYAYFGDKEQLFALVLSEELRRLAAAVPLEHIASPEDVGEYAGAVFDYHRSHPQLIRLLVWEGLHGQPEAANEAARTEHYRRKIAAFRDAQEAGRIGDEICATDMAFLVIALAGWWYAVPQVTRMMYADAPAEPETKIAVMRAATRLAVPKPSSGRRHTKAEPRSVSNGSRS